MKLSGARVLVGVTGGIAAYKSAALVRLLRKAGAETRVAMTAAAQKIITPHTLSVLSEHPAGLDYWDDPPTQAVRHIEMADWAEWAVIAPATANFLAKAAHGLADDLLSGIYLSLRCPVVVAPAMHHQMWGHPATKRNLEILRGDGVLIVEPAEGDLASGDTGPGRMREPEEIVAFLESLPEIRRA